MKLFRPIFIFFIFCISLCLEIQAQDQVFTVIVRRQAAKQSSRWTLASWFQTKKKMALMDQWLALHSSSEIFEFLIEGGEGGEEIHNHQLGTKEEKLSQTIGFTIYALIFGISAKYEELPGFYYQTEGHGNLRILGTSEQATNLIGQYGVRKLMDRRFGEYKQEFWGGKATFYLFDFLGGEGLYRHYGTKYSKSNNYKLSGERIEYGPFIEIGPLRFSGVFYKEKLKYQSAFLSDFNETREGMNLNLKFIF